MPKCQVCKDTGMTGWEKPMTGPDGKIHMIFVPQTCLCEAGLEKMKLCKPIIYNPPRHNPASRPQMTHLVLRRTVPNEDAFASAVQMYANELRFHREHLKRAANGQGDVYPAPQAHPDIVSSVNRETCEPDYQIVDAFPVSHGDIRALELRKHEWHHQVQQMEAVAQHNLLPARKWRLAGLEYVIANEKPMDERVIEDYQVIEKHNRRMAKLREIQLHHARLESEIEDLNFDTVNSWSPRPFGA